MYTVELKPQAERFIEAQPRKIQRQLIKRIESLAANPHPANSKQLHAKKKVYSLRCGVYRIIYQVQHDKLLVAVAKIGHRRNVYERLVD